MRKFNISNNDDEANLVEQWETLEAGAVEGPGWFLEWP